MVTIPTLEEYQKAKEITDAYEAEQIRLLPIREKLFEDALTEYFKSNKVAGHTIKKFRLNHAITGEFIIIPTSPPIEDYYEGENNSDIEKLCEKHGVKARFIYWMYHK